MTLVNNLVVHKIQSKLSMNIYISVITMSYEYKIIGSITMHKKQIIASGVRGTEVHLTKF